MCRIVGFEDFNFHSDYSLEETAVSMRDALMAGGPDDAGLYVDKQKGLALGHRRLSILDLSELGHQPMTNEDKSLWISYNGEVYNFKEIRKELESCGHRFRSNTDTEVVLKAYETWGPEAVNKFRGMWSFALWNTRSQVLTLCRDRVGVKPLYWYHKDGIFIFSSELKALHAHPKFHPRINSGSLSLYLRYGYVPSPNSIFESAHKLEAGTFLEIDRSGKIKTYRYWDLGECYLNSKKRSKDGDPPSEEESADQLEEILVDSFKLRMISDVPVGVFLSGGIDSSILTALLQKTSSRPLKTFTTGFHEKDFNEADWAKKVADHLGTDHTEYYCTPRDAASLVEKLPVFYDEPFGDSSAIPTILVSKLARQQVKVALSADGGDELFCGYPKYWVFDRQLPIYNQIPYPLRSLLSNCLKCLSPDQAEKIYNRMSFMLPKYHNIQGKYIKLRRVLAQKTFSRQYLSFFSVFDTEDLSQMMLSETWSVELEINEMPGRSIMEKLMLLDIGTNLPDDLLTKVDRASMGVSLEAREPFLDHKVLEYALGIPTQLMHRNHQSKYLLRKILYKYVPPGLIERPKQGFGVPVSLWLRKDLKDLYLEYLNPAKIKAEGIFNEAYVQKLLQGYFKGEDVDHHQLWFLFSFQLWKNYWHV